MPVSKRINCSSRRTRQPRTGSTRGCGPPVSAAGRTKYPRSSRRISAMVDNVHYVKLGTGDAAASGLAGPVRVARRLDTPGGPGAGADRAADPGVQVVAAAHHERADHEVP